VPADPAQSIGRLHDLLRRALLKGCLAVQPIQRIIAYVSGFTALAVGDVMATGTLGGVGFTRNPRLFMKEGDMVEVEIESVGLCEIASAIQIDQPLNRR
jgi:hypothetical protein